MRIRLSVSRCITFVGMECRGALKSYIEKTPITSTFLPIFLERDGVPWSA